jgi:hypothetical protein
METHFKRTTLQIVRDISHREGLGAFRRGLEATILRDFAWGFFYFPHSVRMTGLRARVSRRTLSLMRR